MSESMAIQISVCPQSAPRRFSLFQLKGGLFLLLLSSVVPVPGMATFDEHLPGPQIPSLDRGTVLLGRKGEVSVKLDLAQLLDPRVGSFEFNLVVGGLKDGSDGAEEEISGEPPSKQQQDVVVRDFADEQADRATLPPIVLSRFNFKQNILTEGSRGHVKTR